MPRLIVYRLSLMRSPITTIAFVCMLVAPMASSSAQLPTAPMPGPFMLDAGDLLRIRVWPDTALGGEFPVEETGLVYLPALGAVPVTGVAIDDLREDLRERYASVTRTPVITITPLVRVSVLGAVLRPGLYHVDPTQRFSDLMGLAGGFQLNAAEDDTRLYRDGSVIRINAREGSTADGNVLDMELRSGDRIVVPQRSTITFSGVLSVLQLTILMVTLIHQVSG